MNCRWRITRNESFTLKFVRFNVEPSYNCEDDFLLLGESGTKFCGLTLADRQFTFQKDEEVVLIFHSDATFNREGFKVEINKEGMISLIC